MVIVHVFRGLVDIIPVLSNFIPTCAECSTAYAAPGVVSVRGESTAASCRECHHKMSTSFLCFPSLVISSPGAMPNVRTLSAARVLGDEGFLLARLEFCRSFSFALRPLTVE